MAKKLLLPKDVIEWLTRRYTNQHKAWLLGEGQWPITVNLGIPTETDATQDIGGVRHWVEAWGDWNGSAKLSWVSRHWSRLGTQNLPSSLEIATPNDVASLIGQGKRWRTAAERYQRFIDRWPQLAAHAVLGRHFGVLADYADTDFTRLFSMLDWLEKNPSSGLAPRQLPVAGLDTKWLEKRAGVVTDLLRSIRAIDDVADFYSICGLKRPVPRIRARILCPKLRSMLGGLRDIEAPVTELSELAITPKRVIIVENLETGLALPEIPDTVAFMRLGNAVSLLSGLTWLQDCSMLYWGDIDTHGFVILNRARSHFPNLLSVLMDSATLLAYQDLWVEESIPSSETELPLLTPTERDVFEGLRTGRWNNNIRLEQERICWPDAMKSIAESEVFSGVPLLLNGMFSQS